MDELHHALQAFEVELHRLGSLGNDRQKRAIEDFLGISNTVTRNLQRVWNLSSERQRLIDEQCNRKLFHGPLHEKYHETNALLDHDFNNLFLCLETALSRFTTLVVELLPRAETRGIEHAGFSRFVRSVKSLAELQGSMVSIAPIVSSEGQAINDTLSSYRDKNIEHVSDSFVSGFESNGMGGIRRGHTKRKNSDIGTPPSEPPDRSKIPPTCIVDSSDGKHRLYYLHVEATGPEGHVFNKGEAIGTVSDNNCGHFIDYGPHTHIFTTPTMQHSKIQHPTPVEYSPDPGMGVTQIFRFFANVLSQMSI